MQDPSMPAGPAPEEEEKAQATVEQEEIEQLKDEIEQLKGEIGQVKAAIGLPPPSWLEHVTVALGLSSSLSEANPYAGRGEQFLEQQLVALSARLTELQKEKNLLLAKQGAHGIALPESH